MNSGPQLYLNCEWCREFFEYNGGKRKRFCSDAHKQAAWRHTQATDSIGNLGGARNVRSAIVPPDPQQPPADMPE